MKKTLLLFLALFAVIGFSLSACADKSSAPLLGDWRLVSYGSPANPTPAAPNVDTNLTFAADGKINGNMGCNGFGGEYKVSGDTISFGQIMSTLMACDEPRMGQESATFSMFANAATFKITGGQLTITSANGAIAATFARK